jgi:hypothetical protein
MGKSGGKRQTHKVQTIIAANAMPKNVKAIFSTYEPLAKSLASDVPLGCAVILIRHSSILKARHRFFVDEGTPRAPLARFLDTPRPCLAPICLRWKA